MKIRIRIGQPGTDPSGWTDYTNKLFETDWEISISRGDTIDTLTATILDEDGSINLSQGLDVVVDDPVSPTQRFFGGVITNISMRGRGLGKEIQVEAQDYTSLLDRTTVRKTFETLGQTGLSIIQQAFTEAGLTEIDTTTRTMTDRTLDVMNFQGASLRSIIEQIASITGYVWWVDPFKQLVYTPRTYNQASVEFSDTPDNLISFPMYDLTYTKRLADYNTIDLVGGQGLSSDVVEEYSGDGSTTIFITGEQAGTNPVHYPREGQDMVEVDLNTGSQALPVWTAQVVGLEGDSGVVLGTNVDVLWNPEYRRLEFATAPPSYSNAFRIKGRYGIPVIVTVDDTNAKATHGRTFKGSMVIPEATDVKQAYDLAMAYLDVVGDKEFVSFVTNTDGLYVGQVTHVTASRFGLARQAVLVNRLSMRLLGGEIYEYRVDAETT